MSVKLVKLFKGVSIASPWPAVFLEKEDALLVADLHLGLEDEYESKGIHIPKSPLAKVVSYITSPIKELGCSKVFILGDVKHEFGKPKEAEWFGVKRLFKAVKALGCEVEVIRGNHDNYIISILKAVGIKLHQPSIKAEDFLLLHGHDFPIALDKDVRCIIMGHEHPSIVIKDELGVRHRYKAFLSGVFDHRRVLVLPSVSPLAIGSDVNELPCHELLSPILQKAELNEFTPYLIEVGVDVKRFPKVGELALGGGAGPDGEVWAEI